MRADIVRIHWVLFRADAARWLRPEYVGNPDDVHAARLVRMLIQHPPLRAMAWFRFGSAAKQLGVRGVASFVQQRLLRRYGLELSVGDPIGGGLYIAHPVGCVLYADSIGENVTVVSQVTFGARQGTRWPTIGDGTFFGVGARVLGEITVASGATVGANAVVLHDVAEDQVVVGIPARPIVKRLPDVSSDSTTAI